MRRRLLLTTDAVGGVWTYSLELARGLAAADDMVVLLAVLGPAPSAEQLTEAAAVPGLQLIATGLPLDWTASSEQEVRDASVGLAQLAREAEADLVQLHTPALATSTFTAPLVSVIHSCVATWWAAVQGGPLPQDLAWRAALTGEGLERSDLVIAPTRAFARAVQAQYGTRTLPTAVHNGREPQAATRTIRGDYALTAGRLWDAGKNVAAFDRAAAIASAPFRAAGPLSGPAGGDVRLDHAVALGSLPAMELSALHSEQPIFVSVALYEPFGLAVLEAAQAGCALVLADRPGFRELWGEAALFVDPRDEHAIAAAVDRLIAAPATRDALGEAARRRAAEFTSRAMAGAMLDLYALLAPADHKVAA